MRVVPHGLPKADRGQQKRAPEGALISHVPRCQRHQTIMMKPAIKNANAIRRFQEPIDGIGYV